MKKRHKKLVKTVIALLLCTVLGLMTGCSKNVQTGNIDSNKNSIKEQSGDTREMQQTSDTAKLRRMAPEGETITLKAWRPTHTTIGTRIEGWGDALFEKWLEKQTGIHIEWLTPVGGTEADNLAVIISSGEYPDLFFDAGLVYTTGAYGLLKEGVVIDIAKYLDKLPNYSAQLNKSDLRKKESYSDDGNMAAFYRFNKADKPDTTWYGILMRKDCLDKVGSEVPKTYDQWYSVLTAFKNQLGIEKPYLLNSSGFPKLDMFTGGLGFGYMNYGGNTQPFYQVDGKIHYAPLEDSFKKYLQMMNRWYKEGLIDQDFLSLSSMNAEMTSYSDPQTGSMVAPLSMGDVIKQLNTDENAEYVAVPNPVVTEGDKLHIGASGSPVSAGIQVSSKCTNLDLALKWCDLFYSEDVIDISNFGPDDTYYTKAADGTYHFNDQVFSNPDGFAALDMIYSIADYPCVVENDRTIGDDKLIEEGKMYDEQNDNSYVISSALTLTDEETETYNSIMSNIIDYVEEMQVKYIMGIESFNNYDTFVQKIKDMNIDGAMAAYQAALERYNAR